MILLLVYILQYPDDLLKMISLAQTENFNSMKISSYLNVIGSRRVMKISSYLNVIGSRRVMKISSYLNVIGSRRFIVISVLALIFVVFISAYPIGSRV